MEGDSTSAVAEARELRRFREAAIGGLLCAVALGILIAVGPMSFVPSRSTADDAVGPALFLLSVGFAGLGRGLGALVRDRTGSRASAVLAYGIAVALAVMGVVFLVDRYPCGYVSYCSGLGPGATVVVFGWPVFLGVAHALLGVSVLLDARLRTNRLMWTGSTLWIVAGSLFATMLPGFGFILGPAVLLVFFGAPLVGIAAHVMMGVAFLRQPHEPTPR